MTQPVEKVVQESKSGKYTKNTECTRDPYIYYQKMHIWAGLTRGCNFEHVSLKAKIRNSGPIQKTFITAQPGILFADIIQLIWQLSVTQSTMAIVKLDTCTKNYFNNCKNAFQLKQLKQVAENFCYCQRNAILINNLLGWKWITSNCHSPLHIGRTQYKSHP